jgi:hypothetical protein
MLFSVLACVLAVSAQTNLNWKGYGDTASIAGWKGTTLVISKPFPMTNAENKLLCVIFDDTANAGRVADTVYSEVGYELGSPIINLLGNLDTIWTNKIPLDTIDTRAAAAKQYNPALGLASKQWTIGTDDLPVRPHGAIDTTLGTTSSGIFIPFSPYWAPFCRFFIQGISGNQATTYVKGKFVLIQRQGVKVVN